MSMFRRPGDSSSSSEGEPSEIQENTSASADDDLLSRINTLDSAESAALSIRQAAGPTPTTRPAVTRSTTDTHVRNLVLYSLLEDKAKREAAEHLGKDQSDPEVQELARSIYQDLARQISTDADEHYASDEMRGQRAAAHEGISAATRSHLVRIASATAMAGATQALIALPNNALLADGAQTAPTGLQSLFSLHNPMHMPLQGYPGLHTDRYAREFVEIDVVGKGGYGKVYKVKHKLDNTFYAVKRITVSPARMQKIKERGPQELESILEEVRSLARFDHGNIVRYHNAWLEFTAGPIDPPPPSKVPAEFLRSRRLLGDVSALSFSDDGFGDTHDRLTELSMEDPFDRSYQNSGAGIVFEASDPDAVTQESKRGADNASLKSKTPKRNRRGSQATIATISSSKSHMRAIEDADEEEDEDIETIPRTHDPEETTQSMVSDSDMPNHLVSTRVAAGPVLTLNVQMSLYDTNLATFLSAEQDPPNHCFHPCISLELLSNIISGVEYLHAQGVVHRDLKPANVFLSLSTSHLPPSGSVYLSSCRSCPMRDRLHVTPRIGDFGLVAALGDKCITSDNAAKPVGTEFYRPAASSRISEKLDVFALGVVAFELLQRFGTRMERVDALTRLRRGEFPKSFLADMGVVGEEVRALIGGMVEADDEKRVGCEEVKKELERLVYVIKG